MFAGCRCSAVLLGGPSSRSLCRAEARDGGRRSDAGSIVLTSASTRSSTSSNSARLFGTALVCDVAGSSSLALVLGVACSPGRTLLLNIGCTPSCLLLRTVATLVLAVAVLAPPSRLRLRSPLWPASARVDGTRSESALRAPRSCDYVYLHTGRFQWPICAIFR